MIRQKLLDSSVSTLAGRRQVVVICSSARPDRVGDVVVQEGIDVSNFMALGGTVLWQHDASQPIARATEIGVVSGRLKATVQFPPPGVSQKSDEIYGLIQARVVNATSIGFASREAIPLNPKEPWGPQKFLRSELMEFSFVSVPANADAAIVERSYGSSYKGGRVLNARNADALKNLQRSLNRGERAHADAIDSLEEATQHFAKARRHAAQIAASAGGDDTNAPDDTDGSGDADVELSYGRGHRDLDRERRLREVEVLALGMPPDDSYVKERESRLRMVEILELAAPPADGFDAGRSRRMREVSLLEFRGR